MGGTTNDKLTVYQHLLSSLSPVKLLMQINFSCELAYLDNIVTSL